MWKIFEIILGWFKKKKENPKEFPDGMIWLHTDVSDWAITAKCTPMIAGKTINMEHDKKNVWPVAGSVDGGTVANCWIVFSINNQWYAATWEWLKSGQTVKTIKGTLGSYIKKSPVVPTSWHPKSGEKIGLFVSGLCRDKNRNVMERARLVWVVWP